MNVSYNNKKILSYFLLLLIFVTHETSLAQGQYVEGELIIKLKSKLSSSGFINHSFAGKLSQKGIAVKTSFNKMQMHLLKLPKEQSLNQVMSELSADPEVEFVEPNYILRKADEATSRIQPLSYQQMISTVSNLANGHYTQSRLAVGVDEAWGEMAATVSTRPLVAVIDTGVDYNHTVFVQSNAMWKNSEEIPNNGIDDDHNGYIDDVYGWNFFANNKHPWDDEGHGTHVSGIVVGLGIDIYEQPPRESEFQIMALKFLGADGSGDSASAIQAINYAISKGARIINASWGGDAYSRSLHEAFTRAYEQGIFIVTAAGNAGSNNDNIPIYPSGLPIPGLISVAAANSWDRLASFSNYGVQSVHLAAAGVSVGSLYPNNLYGYSSGTSMAAPFIAGVGALLLRESPQLSGFQLKELILNSVEATEAYSQKLYTSGRVNVLSALRASKAMINAQSIIPGYTPATPARAIASTGNAFSDGAAGGVGGGCGSIQIVRSFMQNQPGTASSHNDTPWGNPQALPVIILMFLPLLFWMFLRRTSSQQSTAEISEFDLRFTQRINVFEQILVKTPNGQFKAHLKNISKGGLAFVVEGKQIQVDEAVSFVFINQNNHEEVEISGRIVWTDDKAMMAGVQFNQLSSYIQSFLLRSYSVPSR